jgi:hypothetical protein
MGEIVAPFTEKSLLDKITALEARIRTLELTRQLGTSTLEGDLRISGGSLTVVDPVSGQVGMYLGPLEDGTVGWVLFRDDGTVAFSLAGGLGDMGFTLRDQHGNVVVGDDTTAGEGLARPLIPWTVTKRSEITVGGVVVTSGTFTECYRLHGRRQHAQLRVEVATWADVGTTGEVQLHEAYTGTVLDTQTIPDGDNSYRDLAGPVAGAYDTVQHYAISARRTSGAGNVTVTVTRVEGTPS